MPSTELSHYLTLHYSDKGKYQWCFAFFGTRARAPVTEDSPHEELREHEKGGTRQEEVHSYDLTYVDRTDIRFSLTRCTFILSNQFMFVCS